MTVLTLEQASQIVDAGLARAIELKFRPMTIAVLDAGGHLVAFKRQDRSGNRERPSGSHEVEEQWCQY